MKLFAAYLRSSLMKKKEKKKKKIQQKKLLRVLETRLLQIYLRKHSKWNFIDIRLILSCFPWNWKFYS